MQRRGALVLALLLFHVHALDGLHQPPDRHGCMRGVPGMGMLRDRERRGGPGMGMLRDRKRLPARAGARFPEGDRRGQEEGGREDWDEERQVASLLEQKIIRKVSMKRWLEERQKFYPTPSAVERLKVEEGEGLRDKILAREGWLPSSGMAKYARPQRTRWEETAKRESAREDMPSQFGSWPLEDFGSQPFPGGSQTWGVSELRGGGGQSGALVSDKPRKKPKWRQLIDSIWELEFEKDGKLCSFSFSGLLLDCILASQILFITQIFVDMVVATPALRLVTQVLFPPLLPSLSEFPNIAGMSIMVAHWGMRLAKSALAAICAGHAVAHLAFHGVAFARPGLPVLYTCLSSLWTSVSIIYRILEDPRFKASISFNGIALRLLTCEIPGLMLFFWAACSHKDSSSLTWSDAWSDVIPTAWRKHLQAQLSGPFQQATERSREQSRAASKERVLETQRQLEQEMLEAQSKVDAIRRNLKRTQREEEEALQQLEQDLRAACSDQSEIDEVQREMASMRQASLSALTQEG